MHISRLWATALLSCAALPPFATAEETATPPVEAQAEAADPAASKLQTLQGILFSRETLSDKEFAEAVEKAEKAGATKQQVLDASVFRAVMQETEVDLVALASSLEKELPQWKIDEALSIRDTALGQALVHLLRAKAALKKNDEKTFQAEATLCIWELPQIAELPLGLHRAWVSEKATEHPSVIALDKAIENGDEAKVRAALTQALWSDVSAEVQQSAIEKVAEFRATQKTANLVLPLDIKFEQAQGEAVSLAELLKGKKAVLLDFHASWCGPCMQLLPNLPKEAEKLAPQGVVVAAFNTQSIDDAKKIREKFDFSIPVLAEKDNAYSQPLGVDSIPRYVLISAEGKILFNGHPMDKEKLSAALEKIGVKLEKE